MSSQNLPGDGNRCRSRKSLYMLVMQTFRCLRIKHEHRKFTSSSTNMIIISYAKKINGQDIPCAMLNSTLFNNHCHNSIFIRLPPFFMYPHNLIDSDVAHQITHDEHKIARHKSARIDVSHRIAR